MSSTASSNCQQTAPHTMVLEEPTAAISTSNTNTNTDMAIIKKPSKQDKPLKDKLEKAKNKDKAKKDKENRKSIKYMFMHPLSIFKKSDSRIESFMAVVEQHKEFFVKCPQIDSYLVGMAFDYLQRTKPSIAPTQYSPNLLFCCLYLAWETEEDSTVGVEGIIHYVIGRYPSSRESKDPVARKYEVYEWRKRLRQFHAGKDLLWKALDFNTYVDHTVVDAILALFPDEPAYRRQRQEQELTKYF